jgi:hypothetical protein
VEKITVTERGENLSFMSYLHAKMLDKFSFLPKGCKVEERGERSSLVLVAEKKYCPYIRKFAEYNIAEVIAVGYKHRFFKRALHLPMLSEEEKETLYASLVAADLAEDTEYIRHRLCGEREYCIDGTFHFKLGALKERWEKIISYIPPEFTSDTLISFVEFLVEEGGGKVFLKGDDVYDEEYRLLTRSSLIGKPSQKNEVLLSGAGEVYCFGSVDEKTAVFLKKYYKEKAVFC